MAQILMKGNEAIAEAAIRAGCRSSSAIPSHLRQRSLSTCPPVCPSWRLLSPGGERGGRHQYGYGAAGSGVRVMTSSSSPGVSLKQEGISYIAGPSCPA
jgi:2-oxoglutarate ferredoxin oxidoreductase subunit alpha